MSHAVHHRRLSRTALAVVGGATTLALLLGGCSGGGTEPVGAPATQTPAPTPTPTPTPTADPVDIAPLTGEEVEVGSLDHASIASKIDNHPAARPQVGLQYTDLVFEELVEGGLTRYVAVWQSTIPKEYGPVRSIRPMDPDIVSPFGGIITYSGGQLPFVALMQDTPALNVVHGSAGTENIFYRTPAKISPHNVIVKARDLLAAHDDLKAPKKQFHFSKDVASSTAATDGDATKVIHANFSTISTPTWKWKASKSVWVRSQAGVADKDSKGHQLKATNVIILRVGVSTVINVPKTELVGNGKGWVSSGGKTIAVKWSKKSKSKVIRLEDEDGDTVDLAPGNSWIEMVPESGSVKFE